jgi:carboxymethylenebutenolidase
MPDHERPQGSSAGSQQGPTTGARATEVRPSPEGVPGAVADPSRLSAEELTFPGAGGTAVNGYLARPRAASARDLHPAMIVIHEAGGLNDHIRDVCHRFANVGYVALAVDLYTREGGPPPAGDMQAIMGRLFSMSDATALGDLEGAADYLRSREEASGRIGCIGFCMGGRHTLLFACSSDKLSAAVDCWGGFIDKATPRERTTPQRPTPPLELAPQVGCPLYAAIGAEDHNPSPEIAEQLREALAGAPYETVVEVYEGAGHAFFADYRPTYRPQAAARLWERIVPFLDSHLKRARVA